MKNLLMATAALAVIAMALFVALPGEEVHAEGKDISSEIKDGATVVVTEDSTFTYPTTGLTEDVGATVVIVGEAKLTITGADGGSGKIAVCYGTSGTEYGDPFVTLYSMNNGTVNLYKNTNEALRTDPYVMSGESDALVLPTVDVTFSYMYLNPEGGSPVTDYYNSSGIVAIGSDEAAEKFLVSGKPDFDTSFISA